MLHTLVVFEPRYLWNYVPLLGFVRPSRLGPSEYFGSAALVGCLAPHIIWDLRNMLNLVSLAGCVTPLSSGASAHSESCALVGCWRPGRWGASES